MTGRESGVLVRNTRPEDFDGIIDLCRQVYTATAPWTTRQLESHLGVFPEGQFVAVDGSSGAVLGMAASLVVLWDDYDLQANWRDFTDKGMFTNHDLERGRTLYAAEVMVRPSLQGMGIGSRLYAARRQLVQDLGLGRIRAGARLRGYHRHAGRMTPHEYVDAVTAGQIRDPTLSFQLKHGFRVIAVVSGYLQSDPESLGAAAVVEWLNQGAAS